MELDFGSVNSLFGFLELLRFFELNEMQCYW